MPLISASKIHRPSLQIFHEEKQILEAEKQYKKERQEKIEEERSDKLTITD